ncbi:hypothetical protein TNIN_421771 [Trichonephila inaurata madagascariensis]|uniref:Uncharacterized protein n=1 Tax=Trichonephila inaurata madagascariensis TaxID=2747483 RepID=A0A8X7CBV2_9ARAC|nr:hypothetical protein TNIN_421771 [Trichonephila inaurata madagascariensis]
MEVYRMLREHQTDTDSFCNQQRGKKSRFILRKCNVVRNKEKQSEKRKFFPNRLPIFYEPVKRHLLATSRAKFPLYHLWKFTVKMEAINDAEHDQMASDRSFSFMDLFPVLYFLCFGDVFCKTEKFLRKCKRKGLEK